MMAMTTQATPEKHMMAVGNNGRVTTTFDKIEIGQKCRVMLSGKMEIVEKTERHHWGPSVRNARKCHGRRGFTYVYNDRIVEVVE